MYDATWGRAFAPMLRPGAEGDRGERAGGDAGRAAGRGARPGGRDRRRDRGQPRPLRRRDRGPDPGRARPAHGGAAAGAAGGGGGGARRRHGVATDGGSGAPSAQAPGRSAGRSAAVRRRQLRHRGRDAGPLHDPRSGRRRSPSSPASSNPAAGCSSSSTSAPTTRTGPAGRIASRSPGASWPTAATATATPRPTCGASAFEVETIEHGKMPKAMPIVRPLIRGTAVAR